MSPSEPSGRPDTPEDAQLPPRPLRSPGGVQYHHVGTGMTTSAHWCRTCEGYYGVPHDGDTHKHRPREGCACAPCQKASGRYGSEGVFMEHDRYMVDRAAGIVHDCLSAHTTGDAGAQDATSASVGRDGSPEGQR